MMYLPQQMTHTKPSSNDNNHRCGYCAVNILILINQRKNV